MGGGVLTLHQLQVFAAVVAANSFSGAARQLGLTQPAVSQQVRGLEQHFGQALLDRSGRQMRLTEAGRQIYEYATRVLGLLADMETSLRSPTDALAGRLVLGASTTPGECLLPRLVGPFQVRYPDIQLSVEVTDTAAVLDRLLHHHYDLGLVGGMAHTDRLTFTPFAADELILVAPTGHPLAHGQAVAPAELRAYSFVTREQGSGTRAAVEQALARVGVPALAATMVLGSSEAVKQAVAAGAGLAFISGCALGNDDLPGIVVVPLRGLTIRRTLYLAVERDRPAGRLSGAFRDWLFSAEPRDILAAQRRVTMMALPPA